MPFLTKKRDTDLGLQRKSRQSAGRGEKSKHVLIKLLLGHPKMMGHRREADK